MIQLSLVQARALAPTMTDITLSINPSFLLSRDPARAYSIAALAAAQNDVAVVRAFLDAGLDAANAQHKSHTRGGPSFHHCVWLAAVQNDATDTLSAIVEGLSTKELTRLMSAKPQGLTSWATALRFGSKGSIDFFLRNKLGLRPNDELSAPFGASLLFNAALLGHENVVERLESKGAPTGRIATSHFEGHLASLAHVLAAGDCAASLRRLHARDGQALAASTHCFPLALAALSETADSEEETAANIRVAHPGQLRDRSLMPSAGHNPDRNLFVFDALDWALLAHAKNSLFFLKEVFGAETVSARAEGWAQYGKKNPALVGLRRRNNKNAESSAQDAQQKFIAFCEAIAIGASLPSQTPMTPEAQADAPPVRRTVRL